jgi:hypothetical protein
MMKENTAIPKMEMTEAIAFRLEAIADEIII